MFKLRLRNSIYPTITILTTIHQMKDDLRFGKTPLQKWIEDLIKKEKFNIENRLGGPHKWEIYKKLKDK